MVGACSSLDTLVDAPCTGTAAPFASSFGVVGASAVGEAVGAVGWTAVGASSGTAVGSSIGAAGTPAFGDTAPFDATAFGGFGASIAATSLATRSSRLPPTRSPRSLHCALSSGTLRPLRALGSVTRLGAAAAGLLLLPPLGRLAACVDLVLLEAFAAVELLAGCANWIALALEATGTARDLFRRCAAFLSNASARSESVPCAIRGWVVIRACVAGRGSVHCGREARVQDGRARGGTRGAR